MKRYESQSGSMHLILMIALVLMILGTLGFVFWQNAIQPKINNDTNIQTKTKTTNDSNDVTTKAEIIEASLTRFSDLSGKEEGVFGNPTIKSSQATGYQIASMTVQPDPTLGGVTLLFYKKNDGNWTYGLEAIQGTGRAYCVYFKADDLKEAFKGEPCYDDINSRESTVGADGNDRTLYTFKATDNNLLSLYVVNFYNDYMGAWMSNIGNDVALDDIVKEYSTDSYFTEYSEWAPYYKVLCAQQFIGGDYTASFAGNNGIYSEVKLIRKLSSTTKPLDLTITVQIIDNNNNPKIDAIICPRD